MAAQIKKFLAAVFIIALSGGLCQQNVFAAMASRTVVITINNTNRAPELAVIGNRSINEGALLEFTVTATDADGDVLTLSASNLPEGAVFNAAGGVFSWTPGYASAGSYPNVHFEVTDGALTDSEDITITVSEVNRAPQMEPIADVTANEGETVIIVPHATDPDGDTLTYAVSGLPQGAVYTFDSATGRLEWTVNYDEAGAYTITFTVDDGRL